MNRSPVLTPAARMPWPVQSPFRMRPGLTHLDNADTPRLFLRDNLAPAYRAHKAHALDTHRAEALVGRTDPTILEAMAQLHEAETGVAAAPDLDTLTLTLQEDFVVLRDGDTMTAECLSVCFPSNWRPREKHGLGFAAIHAPVADNQLLLAGANGIIDLAFRKRRMQRYVWLLTPSADLSQHPHAQRTRWEALANATPQELLAQTYFRVERQTTLPLPHLKAGVFFIRVMVCPLADVLACAPGRAGELREALASMSDAVVAYRGMEGVRGRLVVGLG